MVQNPKGEARLCLDRVWFSYGNEPILCGASLEVGSGELVTLAGENGAGKSTVIKLLLGELEPSSGSVRVLGQPVRSLSPHAWCRVGYMPQAQASSLANFPATVAEIVRASVVGSRRDARARADELLGELGLASLARHLVGELSGGQFQRVMLARALANRPQALLLDEPTSGLDAEATADLAQRMRALTARSVAVLLVTHDMARLEALTGPGAGAARLVRLEGGAIIDA